MLQTNYGQELAELRIARRVVQRDSPCKRPGSNEGGYEGEHAEGRRSCPDPEHLKQNSRSNQQYAKDKVPVSRSLIPIR